MPLFQVASVAFIRDITNVRPPASRPPPNHARTHAPAAAHVRFAIRGAPARRQVDQQSGDAIPPEAREGLLRACVEDPTGSPWASPAHRVLNGHSRGTQREPKRYSLVLGSPVRALPTGISCCSSCFSRATMRSTSSSTRATSPMPCEPGPACACALCGVALPAYPSFLHSGCSVCGRTLHPVEPAGFWRSDPGACRGRQGLGAAGTSLRKARCASSTPRRAPTWTSRSARAGSPQRSLVPSDAQPCDSAECPTLRVLSEARRPFRTPYTTAPRRRCLA